MAYAVAIAADHGGFAMKNELLAWLQVKAGEVLDLGNCVFDPGDDYPDFADSLAKAIAEGKAKKGIIICGSGVGACIAANKTAGVRAGLCHDTYSARQGVEHDDMNVLCLGARVIGVELARELIRAFLAASFSGEPRHRRRLEKVIAIESGMRRA